MQERTKEQLVALSVGVFVILMLTTLAIFTIFLGADQIFKQHHTREVVFEQVMGLRQGDDVLVRGVSGGNISQLQLEPDGVHVLFELDQPVALYEDYSIRIVGTSVLGGRQMIIHEGSASRPKLSEGTLLVGLPPIDIMQEAGEVLGEFKSGIKEGKIIENLVSTLDGIDKVISSLRSGEGTLGRLLTDASLYEELKVLAEETKLISTQLTSGKGTMGQLLYDDQLYTELLKAVTEFRHLGQLMTSGEGTVARFLKDDTVFHRVDQALASFERMSDKVASGEGTLGKLIEDDALYEEVLALVTEARAAMSQIRETVPITTFTSVLFGAL